MKITFTKMHGLGNDFIVVDGTKVKFPVVRKVIRQLCDRRFGIGADQLLILGKSRKADFRMDVFNADGGEVEMCGNGIRCLVKYVRDAKLTAKSEVSVETKAGVQKVKALSRKRYCVDMGEPIVKGRQIPVNLSGRVINRPIRVEGREFRITCVSMGNPHCVVFLEDLAAVPIEKIGPALGTHNLFPQRANVEFVHVLSPHEIEMRVWERGAGETLACGTGACAAMVASVLNGLTDRKITVKLRGGPLEVEWSRDSNHLLMTGPAETVFTGEVEV